MKKLGLLLITAMLTFNAHSQSSKNDSTCLPNKQLKIALKKIEQGKQCEIENKLLVEDISNLQKRIDIKDNSLQLFKTKDAAQTQMINNLTLQNENYQKEIQLYQKESATYFKQLRRQKTKTFLVAIAGIAATVGTIFILR